MQEAELSFRVKKITVELIPMFKIVFLLLCT